MEFFLYTFDSDYLKEKFIALENASLLCSKLPKKTPRVFFTRDIQRDYDCEILVVETLRKDAFQWKRTQKLARTVLVTSTPFTSLSAYLAMRLHSAHVCMNKDEVLFSTDAQPIAKPEETELEKFAKQFGIERSHELDHFASLLDVGMLKRRLWLVGSIKAGQKEETSNAWPNAQEPEVHVVRIRTMTLGYRYVFRSSRGGPSELRPLTSIRQHDPRSSKLCQHRETEVTDDADMSDTSGFMAREDWGWTTMLGEELVSKIRSGLMMMNNHVGSFERRKRRVRRGEQIVHSTVERVM